MLQRSKHKETCQCCGSIYPRWTYRMHSIRYCATCLHSVGVKTSGDQCRQADYVRAWRELAGV